MPNLNVITIRFQDQVYAMRSSRIAKGMQGHNMEREHFFEIILNSQTHKLDNRTPWDNSFFTRGWDVKLWGSQIFLMP